MVGKNSSGLPPGFRFHPTDEELIIHYLKNQATSRPCPVSIIPEVDIYKFDPWQLPDKAEFGENEWYFFTPRDRKYPNGVRPNRAAVSGYWKATGTDKAIYSGSRYVGVKKALVFYRGRPPKGVKTDWIMHEYRLSDSTSQPYKQNGSMRLDDWVLCRIYKKKNTLERSSHDQPKSEAPLPQIMTPTTDHHTADQQHYKNIPRTFSLSNLWDFDYMSSISHLLNENPSCNAPFSTAGPLNDDGLSRGTADYKHQLGQVLQQPRADGTRFQVNQTVFVDPSYGLQ